MKTVPNDFHEIASPSIPLRINILNWFQGATSIVISYNICQIHDAYANIVIIWPLCTRDHTDLHFIENIPTDVTPDSPGALRIVSGTTI